MLKELYQALKEAENPATPFQGCLIYGEDPLFYDHLGRGLRALSARGRTLETFDCAGGSFQDFLVSAAAPSFFASHKIVHLLKLPAWNRSEQERLLAWLKEDAASGPVDYLFVEGRKLIGNRFPVTSLKKHLKCLKSGRLRPREAVAWLRSRLKRLEAQASDDILYELVALHEGNLSLIEGELEKLALYVGPGGRIDRRVVERVGADSGGGNIFKFCDFLGLGQPVPALEILDRLQQNRVKGVSILGLVARQYRLLCRLRECEISPRPDRTQERRLAKELGVQDFVVRNLLPQLEGIDRSFFARAFAILSRVDRALKGSGIPEEILLSQMVLNLCALKERPGRSGDSRRVRR
jgi:DNA polymerase-3 subunit delta